MRLWRNAVLILAVAGFSLLARPAWSGVLENWAQANHKANQGRLAEAIGLFDKILEAQGLSDHDRAKVFASRGVVWRKYGDQDKALADFRKALALDGNLKEAYLNRGNLWRLKGRPYKALADYSKALELDQGWAPPYHGIAWLMATSRDSRFRNGRTALEMAEKAVSLERNANHLDTLAAARAQNGQFQKAVQTEKEALGLLGSGGRKDRREAYERRLNSYRAGRPWRE
jgi:tetratricopeptide (TPR) repeat protein